MCMRSLILVFLIVLTQFVSASICLAGGRSPCELKFSFKVENKSKNELSLNVIATVNEKNKP